MIDDYRFRLKTPIMRAAEMYKWKRARYVIKLLLEKGANINDVNDDGDTSLHNMIMYKEHETIKWLVENTDINVNHQNKKGETALHIAFYKAEWYSPYENIKTVLGHGANIQLKDKKGNSVLNLLKRHPLIEANDKPNTPNTCLLYTSPSPRDRQKSRMPSSA